jgi:hypothetical protein
MPSSAATVLAVTPNAKAALPALSNPPSVGAVQGVSIAAAAVAANEPDAQVERAVEDFQSFISFIFSVSIFGASTFAVIVSQMADPIDIWRPDPPPFGLATVRTFLAIAWLCFILAIAVAGYSSSILTLWREMARGFLDKTWKKKWDSVGIVASVILHLLLVTAFLFLSLALVAYVGVVGWVAVGFSSLAGVFVSGLSAYQCL